MSEGMSTPTDECGDLLILNIWKHQTDCILDVRFTNLEHRTETGRYEEREKIFPACLDQPRKFSPFAVSCDGVQAKAGQYVQQTLAGAENISEKSFTKKISI